ncbi:MAG: hypothetical protein P8017_14145 [Deltaproteobacteria bacterium]
MVHLTARGLTFKFVSLLCRDFYVKPLFGKTVAFSVYLLGKRTAFTATPANGGTERMARSLH